MDHNVSHKVLIQSMLSFAIANVGDGQEFWQPLFQQMIPLAALLIHDDLYMLSNFAHVVASKQTVLTAEQNEAFRQVFVKPEFALLIANQKQDRGLQGQLANLIWAYD